MFRNRLYLGIVSSHFVVDMLNSINGVLLAVLSVPLGLSNTDITTAITLYVLVAAVAQPVFGWLTDRVPDEGGAVNRLTLYLVGISVLWMGFFFGLIAFTPTWGLLLVFFGFAALGSGLFHPIGTAYSSVVHAGSANMATAVFFLCGQMGLAFGPIMGGLLFDRVGSLGVLPMAVLAVVPAGLMWSAAQQRPASAAAAPAVLPAAAGQNWGQILRGMLTLVVLAFIVLVAMRSSIQAVYQFLLPKLFEDRGWQPSLYGLLAGIYMGTAAVGNVLVGKLADRFGMRAVTVVSLLASVPVGLLFLSTSSVLLIFAACALVGFLTGGQHSILVVHAQRLLPVRKGLAAGLILGFTFGSGTLGAWLCGFAADTYSLQNAMLAVVLLGIPAALLALLLPGRAGMGSSPQPVPAPAARS